MKKNDKYVLVGSGISALTYASLLCTQGKGQDIIILDKNKLFGGLYQKYDYGEWGYFDVGMHNILETGKPIIDELIYDLLPRQEWQHLNGSKRDLAGSYVNGNLQVHTPYIDIRNFTKEDFHLASNSIFSNILSDSFASTNFDCSAEEYAIGRFGLDAAKLTLIPAVEKIWKRPASDLDYMSTTFTPLSRLAICNEDKTNKLTNSKLLRDLIAWPDQRTLPLERSSGRNAIYPKKYGMYRVLDAFIERLRSEGVTFLSETEVLNIHSKNGAANSISIKRNDKVIKIENVKSIVWTSGIPLAAKALDLKINSGPPDKPLKTVLVNMVLESMPEKMEDLYYFFCYEEGFYTYRLTNFSNYCEGAKRNGGYPICMELLIDESEMGELDIDKKAREEFQKMGLGESSSILFSKVEVLGSGFPMPTRKNILALQEYRNAIIEDGPRNINLIGILAKENLFFQTHVLQHVAEVFENDK